MRGSLASCGGAPSHRHGSAAARQVRKCDGRRHTRPGRRSAGRPYPDACHPIPPTSVASSATAIVVLPDALPATDVRRLRALTERVRRSESPARNGAVHALGFIEREPGFATLVDQPRVLDVICSALGWNVHVYHCHLDVHPPALANGPPPWRWHQDGGRQNLEIESDPRPRLSVKVAWFLSDVSRAGRGNLQVIPGSHRRNRLPRPDDPTQGLPPPAGAIEILASPGTAVIFDRRLWHARGENRSRRTRRALFLGYTYRWIRARDGYPRVGRVVRGPLAHPAPAPRRRRDRRRPLAPHRRRCAAPSVDEGTRVPGRIATLTGNVEGSSAVGARARADGGALPGGGGARRRASSAGPSRSPPSRSRTTARRRWLALDAWAGSDVDWRGELRRYYEEHIPVRVRPAAAVNATLRRLHTSGVAASSGPRPARPRRPRCCSTTLAWRACSTRS